jgi:hypothetical protein
VPTEPSHTRQVADVNDPPRFEWGAWALAEPYNSALAENEPTLHLPWADPLTTQVQAGRGQSFIATHPSNHCSESNCDLNISVMCVRVESVGSVVYRPGLAFLCLLQAVEQRVGGFIGVVDAGSSWESAQSVFAELTVAAADQYLFEKLPQLNSRGDLVWQFSDEAKEGTIATRGLSSRGTATVVTCAWATRLAFPQRFDRTRSEQQNSTAVPSDRVTGVTAFAVAQVPLLR